MFRQKCPKPFPRSAARRNGGCPCALPSLRSCAHGASCPGRTSSPSMASPPSGLPLLSPVLGARYGWGEKTDCPDGILTTPLDAGEHWSEQAKPKGAARTAAPSHAGQDAPCVKRAAEPFRAGIRGRTFFSSLFFGRAKKRDPSAARKPPSKSGGSEMRLRQGCRPQSGPAKKEGPLARPFPYLGLCRDYLVAAAGAAEAAAASAFV